MKLGDKLFYTFEEAAEILSPLYTAKKLKDAAYRNTLPHSGGRGKGKVCYSNDDLKEIIKMNKATVRQSEAQKPASLESVPQLPASFRQTSRSRARHRSAA